MNIYIKILAGTLLTYLFCMGVFFYILPYLQSKFKINKKGILLISVGIFFGVWIFVSIMNFIN